MAALELHCGPEPGSHVWGGERVDLLDSFDSEMQEWEDQLQEMQKKIEELYNEVKARRKASETNQTNITSNKNLDITLLPVSTGYGQQANGYYHGPPPHPNNNVPVHQCSGGDDSSVRQSFGFHHTKDYHNGSNNYTLNPLINNSNYPGSCHDIERQDATLDILNGYLQQGPQLGNIQRNFGTPKTNSKVHPVLHSYQENMKTGHATNRSSSCAVLDELEEAKNKKNKSINLEEFQAHQANWKDSGSSNNLPLKTIGMKQRDAPPVPPRSSYHEAPKQPDRKCLLVDRKSGSPSVLRKFGAMLQENEGKTLIEDGVITTVIPTDRLASTPVCQRKFSVGRVSPRVPIQKSLVDCDRVTAELEPSQEPWAAVTPRHMLLNGDSMKGISAPERCNVAFNLSPPQSRFKAEHHSKEAKEHKSGFQGEDLFSDYRMVETILGTGSQHYGKVHAGLGGNTKWGNDNLDQLLEMMEMENIRSQRSTFTQQMDTKQEKRISRESSPIPRSSSFSRPARPANQRRPTRWATPSPSKIISKSCPASPCVNGKQLPNSYCLHTETVIM